MNASIERYLQARAARGIRPATLRYQRFFLRCFAEWLIARGIADARYVTPRQIAQYQAHLLAHRYTFSKAPDAPKKALAPRTRYDQLATVCRFFGWLTANRVLLADPTAACALGRRQRFQPRNVLSESEVMALLAAPDLSKPIGLRDRAILELFYSTGLRRAEVAALDLTDVDLTGGTVLVRCGKGGRSRLVPLGETAAEALLAYLRDARPRFLKKPGVTALFLAAERCGQTGQRLSAHQIKSLVQSAGEKAGIPRRVTPHALRHCLATHMLKAGADIRHVQEILGHRRVDTTEAYTHLVISDLANAHARTHPRGKMKR